MPRKLWPLILLAVVVFVGAIFRGATEYGPHHSVVAQIHTFVMIGVIYWWYVLDKRERQFKAGILQNAVVVVFAPLGLLIYFFRSRNLKLAALATAAMIAAFIGFVLLVYAGETIGSNSAF